MERIGNYRLIRQLGSGGMGEVYVAVDERLGRTVALKLLASEMAADPRRLQRFEREGRAASTLMHPNIAQVYEAGGDDGARYIAMELIEGETLEKRISREELAIAEIVRLGSELAEAVADAHSHGITHRDIKSANVMLTRSGHVKVLDFGLARIEEPAAGEEETQWRTVTGLVMGTAPYMSPEQALGRHADARSDIFSMGVVLYEMVTRRLPFPGGNIAETMQKVINAEPDPMARFNYQLPVELERIIRKCLEKQPGRRYQSAKELVVDLNNLARDIAARAALPVSGSHAKPRWPVPRILLGLALPLILFVGFVLYQWRQSASQVPSAIRSIAVLPFVEKSGEVGDQYMSAGFTDDVISALSQIRELRVMNRDTVHRLDGTIEPLAAVRRLKGVQAYVTGEVAHDGTSLRVTVSFVRAEDGTLISQKTFEQRRDQLDILHRAIVNMVLSSLGLDAVEEKRGSIVSSNIDAYLLYREGKSHWEQRTGDDLEKAIALFNQAVELDPEYAAAYAGLANSYSLLERYAGKRYVEVRRKARDTARRALFLDPYLPDAHVAHGSFLEMDRDWVDAEVAYRKGIALGPSNATAYHWYAMLLTRLARHDEAIANIEEARKLDPLNPLLTVAAANVHYYARNYAKAEEEARAAIRMDPSSVLARIQLGLALSFGGDHEQAVRQLESVTSEAVLSDTLRVQSAASLAVAHAAAGNRVAAQQIAARLEQSPRSADFAYALAAIRAILGETDKAFYWLNAAQRAFSFWITLSAVEPAFSSIRSDPRFNEILVNAGLSEELPGEGRR
jgi:eukaryotic-like serine/threonine-protein kinase